jgi:glutathione-regulated potassium-efflux system ancillary protein KefG
MERRLDRDDLVDAQAVAQMLGLAQRNTVSLYQRRYSDMPRPVIDLGRGRCKMWLRSEITEWALRVGRKIHDTRN